MNMIHAVGDRYRWTGRQRWIALIVLCPFAVVAWGDPPIDPLPAPLFSFHIDSPAVQEGIVDPDAVLALDFPHPMMRHQGGMFGMGRMGDDLNAMSSANASFPAEASFALLFSIDEGSVGIAPPDPDLVALGVPYNATDQVSRGHAAGDQFLSSSLFTLVGGRASPGRDSPNNVLVRNNFDEGGTDFAAEPPTSAQDVVVGEPQDRVNATVAEFQVARFYFSASAESPSLDHLPGHEDPSGAHIFSHMFRGQHMLYAAYYDLGLQQEDDIDGMIVFDTNDDDSFNGSDRVLFSLAPDSPSLTTIPGASADGAAADVFVAQPGQAPALFASAAMLGLGHPQDNIDALEYLECDEVDACAAAHGIRGPIGIPAVSGWGLAGLALLMLAVGAVVMHRPPKAREVTDQPSAM